MRAAWIILAIGAFAAGGWAQIGNIVVTSGASFQEGMTWAGSIASVFCTGLKGISGVVAADSYPLPLELAGVKVKIGRVPAPLFAVAELGGYQQINLQVPWEATFARDVTVEQAGEQATAVASRRLYPGEFFRVADGSGALQHGADYTLVSGAKPARAGEVVLGYLTGLGLNLVPPLATGQPAPAIDQGWQNLGFIPIDGVPRPAYEISVGAAANQRVVDPLFLGLAPGLVGVYQVNFTVPAGLAAGNQPVMLVENACATMFGTCILVYPFAFSLPVPMAVQ